MKAIPFFLLCLFTPWFVACGQQSSAVRQVTPVEAAKLVEEGKAVLVDVREPQEWTETGVAEPAQLISLGELEGPKGQALLERNRDKEIIFYCRSGRRAGTAAKLFLDKGAKVANAGGFGAWQKAGLPVRKP